MQSVIEYLKAWQSHPFVDHFTVALILLGILTDLVASIFSSRIWMRYMAVTLMVAGAIGAFGSNITGGWEAGRVWDSVNGPGKAVLERHARLGDILPWVFAVVALWRLGVQFVGFIAGSRPVYLIVAIIAGGALIYQGHLGAVMVYDYGVGTALLTSQPAAPPAVPAPGITNLPGALSSLLPSPMPSTTPGAEAGSSASIAPTPVPSRSATPMPSISTNPSTAAPSPLPSIGSSGSSISPLPAESPAAAGGGAKNL
jgi:uncharacterized membrane protein